jgi:hypothetical protein
VRSRQYLYSLVPCCCVPRGGGVFLPDGWYDVCDELGVMVYHDMQYAQQGHSPKNTTSQDAELRHQVRRLSHHPSIVMYDGCNECRVVMNTPTAIYATFVMTVVAQVTIHSTTFGVSTVLPMVYPQCYLWYIHSATYGISTVLPMVYPQCYLWCIHSATFDL